MLPTVETLALYGAAGATVLGVVAIGLRKITNVAKEGGEDREARGRLEKFVKLDWLLRRKVRDPSIIKLRDQLDELRKLSDKMDDRRD